ncbi:hypothetical protein [Deinococcus sp.]|uniref:hypothetical protein n=1 Tax=Deinococcus sp. TaxID=47478 RepID=UPI002869BDC1|nr:hypothetical protein [Deinococcus sp.]
MLTAPSHAPHPIRARKLVNHRSRRLLRAEQGSIAWIGAGFAFALIAPAMVVSPMDMQASAPAAITAASLTLVGVCAALTAGWIAFQRSQVYGWLISTWLPAFGLVAGAAVLAATKMY